ncbi:GntR family transcriptional regulator [Neptunomonas phycophila]|uniref:GntR family transcriptional regulator n=1 Tax=Neptunomonas phycophila TaxID=1572645 RepID=A0ABT9EPJ8_9GAMM|nr:GntR family transcriptional regulator [Neptunomonas phycophila]MDP2520993.1 GntR family transcriptional regulator [Neptunomonas phycophila]
MKGKLRYELIYQTLDEAIRSGTLTEGLVLLEGPLGDLFGTSRVPVRKALMLLNDELKISRFDGRGFVVGDANSKDIKPIRRMVTKVDVGLESDQAVDNRTLSEKIFEDLFEQISTCMVFGHYRVEEGRAAEYYGVSKMVIRQALLRLRDRGVVEKEPYSSWLAGPLTAREIRNDYEIRAELEPAALKLSAKHIDQLLIAQMVTKHEEMINGQEISIEDITTVEDFLHGSLIKHIDNKKLLDVLNHCRSSVVLNKVFFTSLNLSMDVAALKEHKLVLELLLQGAVEAASASLKDHLINARKRSLQRLKVVSVLPDPKLPAYLVKV